MLSLNGLKLVHVFKSRSMFLVKLGELKLGTHMFMIVMYFWLTISLVRMKCTSLSLLIIFCLKSILSDIKIPIPFRFLIPLNWSSSVNPFTLSYCLFLKIRYISGIQKIDIVFWYSHPTFIFWLENWGHQYLKLLLKYMC